ncbi:MAG: glycosyl transferase family 1 [Flavobacteriia bacterium]|nr:MAG: glycosyl transferase family 1 [Flavobacteriia bacterium]
MATLGGLLEDEGFDIIRVSSYKNKLIRMLHMVFATLFYKKDLVLIDTYSAQSFYYAYVTSQIARLIHKPYITILHGGNLPQRLDQKPRLSQAIFKHALTNVAPSGYMKYEFESRGYSTTLIPNVLDLKMFKYKSRADLQPRLLWVRAFAQFYHPTMAVRVLHKLKETYPKAELCMVGPKKDKSWEETHALVKTLDLEKSVTFTGVMKLEDWIKLSEDYDVFINTTTIDNTPLSVMEAMALGLPVVSTNVGGLPYLVEDGLEAFLVDSGDVEAMVKAVKRLLSSSELVTSLTDKAKHKVDQFDWSVVRQQWFKLLGKL